MNNEDLNFFPVSVVIPVFNGAAFLAEAIESVLAQTHPPAEIMVVDDGSSDRSLEIAQSYPGRVRCLSTAHAGPAAARNRGIELAGANWLAFLDADDTWLPDKLQIQLEALQGEPELDLALGMIEQFFSPEIDPTALAQPAGPAKAQAGYHAGAMLIRRASFLRVGLFNEALQSGEFIDWWARAMDLKLTYRILPAVVMRRRVHGQNHTLRNRDSLHDYLRVTRDALNRRRQNR